MSYCSLHEYNPTNKPSDSLLFANPIKLLEEEEPEGEAFSFQQSAEYASRSFQLHKTRTDEASTKSM
jgi:hypothetical protein